MGLPDERALIEALTSGLEPEANRAGFASDCAIVPLGERELVASVDAFAADTHFPDGLGPRGAGRLAGRAALADLASAGADVLGALAAYGVPPEARRADLEALSEALGEAVREAGGEVLGGDTKPREQLSVAIAVLGTCPAGEAMTRSGARPGDRLLVTGPLGGAGAALDRVREGLAAAEADPLVPPDRVPAGRRLREAGVRCASDLSDGLAEAAVAIAGAAGVRVVVDRSAVPLHPWARESPRGVEHALSTGGDYELAAAVPADRLDEARAGLTERGLEPAIVGRVEAGEGAALETEDGVEPLERGHEHGFGPSGQA